MRHQLLAMLAGVASANPVPQGFDWNAIDAITPINFAEKDIPVVNAVAAQTIIPAPAASVVAASVSAAIAAAPTDSNLKRDSSCPTPSAGDTAENFASDSYYSDQADHADRPAGYILQYLNANASSQGVMGYMGYSVLQSYDPLACSEICDNTKGCQSFNIYFERDPAVSPTDSCPNPASEVVIKCVQYGGPITPASATNDGQWRNDFHVVIAGSNGFTNSSIVTPTGYSSPTLLNKAAIQAPNDCNGNPTYMTVKTFSGNFDVSNCATACSAQTAYNAAHPAQDGTFQSCTFFNTYVLYNDSTAVGQYCALYNESWPASFATNNGQWRGNNWFNLDYSYTFTNTTGNLNTPVGCTNPSAPRRR